MIVLSGFKHSTALQKNPDKTLTILTAIVSIPLRAYSIYQATPA